MIIKKRQLLLSTLVVALAAAVFVNWYYTRPHVESASVSATTKSDSQDSAKLGDARYVISTDVTYSETDAIAQANEYFASADLRRKSARDEACEALNDIIKDSSSSADAVEKASAAMAKITDNITLEADIENLITAKVGCKNLVILNNGNAEIIVENGALDGDSVVQIKEIAVKQTGYASSAITIIEMEY